MQHSRALHLLLCLLIIVVIVTGCVGPPAAPVPASPPVTGTAPTSIPTPSSAPTPSEKIATANDDLSSLSDDLYQLYSIFRVDEDVADYILFTQSLPKDFQLYALGERLCIQDRKLTDLEKQFLEEPDTYLQQMFDSYIYEISKIDPELATQVQKLPYFRTLDIKDVEAIEDFLWLANNPKYRPTLEKIYGKGIERRMHSVALEALLWRAYTGHLDAKRNPLEDQNYSPVFTRLAEFQEKYKTQMDETDSVVDKKPQILGIEHCWEPWGTFKKAADDFRMDYALMRWVLGANAVKLWGFSGRSPFEHVKMANEEGLDVWLEFNPSYYWERNDPDISVSSYCESPAKFAQEAEKAEVKVLVVGHEVDIHLTNFKAEDGNLRRAVGELVETARQNYSGLVTYCNWPDVWDVTNINWQPMDFLHPQLYKSDCKRELTDKEYLDALLKWKNTVPGKPLVISEWGSVTVEDPLAIGACNSNLEDSPYQYDPIAQAEAIERSIEVLLEADIHGFFLHNWDDPDFPDSPYEYAKNWSEIGYGIWNSKTNEPKPSFWMVRKYYKEK